MASCTPTSPITSTICVVCISDTHNATPIVPAGDVLIHAGDLTQSGTADEARSAVSWIASLPHPVKIVVAGNHDKALDKAFCSRELLDHCEIDWAASGITYLEHSGTQITIRGRTLTVFGSPFTPEYGNWAFQYPQPKLLPARARNVWASISHHVDILVTHGPPHGHMDIVGSQHVGCVALFERLQDIRPVLHVFGHVHAGRGVRTLRWDPVQKVSGWSIKNLRSGMLSAIPLLSRRDSTLEYRDTTLLVNASIQAGNRDAGLNDPEVVHI
ncbi:uncharacterized protein LACBIDRAFT_314129 [Laccaria bicolor S238N-H82]|uniref:Predicted protein n=1 Tax=Laccaria bicolor (strain S238N-H82 / ATCC MYA-4686) TaxID=486041 RepID=B0D1N5_LACBS|nr:uncharacterized protein LACBIDRAFT_314129 [Laccaria bicolor S238N-H82]EDR11673.1 predicted protein [Laccaria bicolor S238N-H82]|eukprot:XP_001877570.1 predicted protein [Laccaria bicolor S238N-H82]